MCLNFSIYRHDYLNYFVKLLVVHFLLFYLFFNYFNLVVANFFSLACNILIQKKYMPEGDVSHSLSRSVFQEKPTLSVLQIN